MDDTLIYIPNDNIQIFSSVDYTKLLKRLDTQLNNQRIKIQLKSPKLLNQKKGKVGSLINSQLSPSFLIKLAISAFLYKI